MMRYSTLERLDALAHRLHLPTWLMGRLCDEYDRRTLGEDDEEFLLHRVGLLDEGRTGTLTIDQLRARYGCTDQSLADTLARHRSRDTP